MPTVEHYRNAELFIPAHGAPSAYGPTGQHRDLCCRLGGASGSASPLITGADLGINGLDQAGFPTVIKAQGRLGSPLDDWYLWCAPHDNPGGIYLFTAPAPGGPWTERGRVLATPATWRHISSPYVLWDGSQFVMWLHALGPSGNDTQQTYRATSADGLAWALNQTPVIPLGTDPQIDTFNASYMNVIIWGGTYYGYYQGSTSTSASHIIEVTSTDGITWTKTAQQSNNAAWANTPGWSYQKPHPFIVNGELLVACTVRPDASSAHNEYRVRASDGTFGPAFYTATQPRPGEWDEGKVEFGDVVYHDGRFWTFYSANAALVSDGDAIGVRSVAAPQSGFDTSYGKG